MSGKLLEELGELQRAVIEVIWELGEATVHQVRRQLRASGKRLAYTTVLTPCRIWRRLTGYITGQRARCTSTYQRVPRRSRHQLGANVRGADVRRRCPPDVSAFNAHQQAHRRGTPRASKNGRREKKGEEPMTGEIFSADFSLWTCAWQSTILPQSACWAACSCGVVPQEHIGCFFCRWLQR